jgi:hypothetical protein
MYTYTQQTLRKTRHTTAGKNTRNTRNSLGDTNDHQIRHNIYIYLNHNVATVLETNN